ncbi:MAG: penicillin-binding protein 2 [Hungatella sp.]|jgi:peptidoglycan glycosyltransferase|nr:penicillin-binding protein 2 [Hungatella sp.]
MRLNIKRETKKEKRKPSPGEKMNKNMLGLGYGVVILFMCLMVYMVYFLTVQREEVIGNPYNNPRLDKFSGQVERGRILGNDRTVLAETRTGEDKEEIRVYPFGELFAHGVGYSTRGKTGLEALANFYLLSSHINPLSQAMARLSGRKSPGDWVVTTLDLKLQQAAAEALGDQRGAVVVMEPSTGRILAMVSKPGFDPNGVEADWESLVSEDGGQARLLNRAAQGLYPPGSVFKIVTVLAYIRQHPDDYDQFRFDCDGHFERGDYTIQCYHGNAHGSQDIFQAFANSCNGAFAAMGLELDPGRLLDTATGLLFGQDLPVDMAYTGSRFSMDQEAGDWDIIQTSIGQGLTQMTPLHNALITAAIANNGVLMRPCLLDHVENGAGDVVKDFSPEVWGELMTLREAEILKTMMKQVVTEGTGSALRDADYTAAGKTGSAQFETGKDSHAWFTGFAPAEDPRIVVTVIVEEGGSGGQTAAPVARKIFDALLSTP